MTEARAIADMVTYLESPTGMQLTRGSQVKGPGGLLELTPDNYAVELSLPQPTGEPRTVPVRVSGCNQRWSAGLYQFAGYRTPEEVWRLLCGAQIFVSSGRKEAQPISLLEARAAGLPIVARAGGGVGEVMESGRHGFIARDRREFVDAITRLVCDEDLRHAIGSETRAGLERFGWDAVVDRHLDVYRRAIAVRHGRNGGSGR